jgi:hypothetical protein
MKLTNLPLKTNAAAAPAAPAAHSPSNAPTVATVASAAVANPQGNTINRLTFVDEMAIRAWLAGIGEYDRDTVADVIENCRLHADARAYFLSLAREHAKAPEWVDDFLITCRTCRNLVKAVCSIAAPDGTVRARKGYRPRADQLQNCPGYRP